MLAMCCVICAALPAAGQSLFDNGVKEFQAENYEEALHYFLNAAKDEPKSSRLAYYIGLTYKAMEDFSEAIPFLREAVVLSPRTDEALVVLIDVLYCTDNLKEAAEWIAVAERDRVNPARIHYLKGLLFSKEGKLELAVTEFEKSKELDPLLGQEVEMQIAAVYVRQGRFEHAGDRLRSAVALGPTNDIGIFARDIEKIIATRIEREKPWRFNIGLAYKYDTNVIVKGNGSLAESISGQEDSTLNFSARVSYTAPFSFRTPLSLSAYYVFSADRYFGKQYTRSDGSKGSLTEYNNMTNQFTLVPGYTFGRFAIRLPLSYSYMSIQGQKGLSFYSDFHWATQTRYLETVSITPTLRFITTGNSFGEVFFGYTRKKYFETELHPGPVLPEEERSGKRLVGGVNWNYFFNRSRGVFTVRYSYGRENTHGQNWDNSENRLGAEILCPIVGPLKAYVSAEGAFVRYSHSNSFFNERRRDDVYDATLGLIYEILNNTDIVLQYKHIENRSNIPLYEYRRNLYALGVEYRF